MLTLPFSASFLTSFTNSFRLSSFSGGMVSRTILPSTDGANPKSDFH